jgi:hypothetical protein
MSWRFLSLRVHKFKVNSSFTNLLPLTTNEFISSRFTLYITYFCLLLIACDIIFIYCIKYLNIFPHHASARFALYCVQTVYQPLL